MKTILITGANKGIGLALVQALAPQAQQVLLGARNAQRAEAAIAQLATQDITNVTYVHVDLADSAALTETVAAINATYPDLDLLINNAGIPGGAANSLTTPLTDLQTTMQVNFFGTYQLTQGLLPRLNQNAGRIVNITIPTDPNPLWNPLAYKTSKAAQNVMTQAMALDLTQAKAGATTFSIHPGPTTTDLNGNLTYPGFHSPADVATKISALLNDGQSHHGEFIEIYPQLRG
ncbi:SDR family NAD(P)-dependent oxidoreductase [Loigolactobacillus bifermentans]|jgi:NAD(P)-dependent dehydrogenase (short-subunit alcohol dehydrogenase family)|uniref:Carbonyl reductase n=1 Tax=Loigolactobacillus bifermentans DSM 20003 TaxID=1423726 RepID=A0A0R1GYP2_9LACO|nr:SDR family oxidoreductase [Loigolactobacillus bifermentans]KRK39483.1 hypothetical protein FC07_GL002452 [Loigolactobacillus bifermentans DSM 20003]QGG61250.1 SDR family NAD(P)-dependent oxidoreductase [Loigolactobacillus bifermentans]